jgi:hypothetical protein
VVQEAYLGVAATRSPHPNLPPEGEGARHE